MFLVYILIFVGGIAISVFAELIFYVVFKLNIE